MKMATLHGTRTLNRWRESTSPLTPFISNQIWVHLILRQMHAAFSVRLFSLPLVLVGCNPEEEDNELLGCMDPDAANFKPDETFDDGSFGTPCPKLGQEMPELKKKT